MQAFSKISHVSFSARDAAASARWWCEVFDFVELEQVSDVGWRGVVLLHRPTATVIEFQQHDANEGEAFDPRRTGFDHMGFKVDERADLDDWKAHFEALSVTHSLSQRRSTGPCSPSKTPMASSSRCSTGKAIPSSSGGRAPRLHCLCAAQRP